MNDRWHLLVFRLEENRYAMPLEAVERVIHAVEVTPVPRAPEFLHGVINMEGQVVPVVNLRRAFGLADREIGPADHFLIGHVFGRRVAMVVDGTEGVYSQPRSEITEATDVVPRLGRVQGITRLHDGLVVIYDLDQFLSREEAEALEGVHA